MTRRGRNREEANYHCDLTAEAKNFKDKSNGWEHRSLEKEASCGNGIYFDNTKQKTDVQFQHGKKLRMLLAVNASDFFYNF